jgi:hypothetical protein
MSAHHAKGAGSTRLVGIVFPKEKWAGGRAWQALTCLDGAR